MYRVSARLVQVVTFLAIVMGSHTSILQVLKGCTHRHFCLNGKEHELVEEWQKWNSEFLPNPRATSITHTSDDCKASTDGPLRSRSISPWSYELDRDLNRLPQDLYHAKCSCSHCVSLETGSEMDPLGNSEPLYHNQTVFYRRRCPREHGTSHNYCLEPQLYPVSLACVCVRPRMAA